MPMGFPLFNAGRLGRASWRAALEESGLPNSVGAWVTVFGARPSSRRYPPRLIVRTLRAIFATVFTILAAVFVVLTLDLRARVKTEVADNLETGRLVLADLERRRLPELDAHLAALTRNPTFEAAVLKYRNELGSFSALEIGQSMAWLQRELDHFAEALGVDVAAALDDRNLTMARGGPAGATWPRQSTLVAPARGFPGQGDLVQAGNQFYRVTSVPLVLAGDRVGTLCLASRLDQRYASNLSMLTRAQTAVVAKDSIVASTLPAAAARALASAWRGQVPERGEVTLAGQSYAFRRFDRAGGAALYGLAPLSTPASRTTAKASRALGLVAAGSLALAAVCSFLLARTLARPIGEISRSVSTAVTSGNLHTRLKRDGSSRELDGLTETFNDLMASLSRAEGETQTAHVGAIEALAIALEARDPCTAGHSERVSDVSVRIGRRMGMPDEAIEVLRLGALLHDIGKIGVSDVVLRKRGPLVEAEIRAIRAHPTLGARILQPVAFLAPHLAIVELHHEQPDGNGYPHGLDRDQIPLPARIVRLADAYDAMTSDRPYRPGRSPQDAVAEILRYRGLQFDEAVVDAFLEVMREADPRARLAG
jgi:HAMP domain-containing protein